MAQNATTMGTYLKMPMAGQRSATDASAINAGTRGQYWSSSPQNAFFTKGLNFTSSSIYPQSSYHRAGGLSIRLFKDTPVIPDNSWTTLYD